MEPKKKETPEDLSKFSFSGIETIKWTDQDEPHYLSCFHCGLNPAEYLVKLKSDVVDMNMAVCIRCASEIRTVCK